VKQTDRKVIVLTGTWTREAIQTQVIKAAASQLQIGAEEIEPTSRFVDDLGADSLDLTELAIAFEDAFEIEIPDSDFGYLSTVAGVVDYLAQRLV